MLRAVRLWVRRAFLGGGAAFTFSLLDIAAFVSFITFSFYKFYYSEYYRSEYRVETYLYRLSVSRAIHGYRVVFFLGGVQFFTYILNIIMLTVWALAAAAPGQSAKPGSLQFTVLV